MSGEAAAFAAGSILWVKCGQLFWPGQVQAEADMSQELKDSIRGEKRTPICVVKFFNEDGYEFLYDTKNVFPYNCERKEEFIKKGIVKSRTKSKEGATTGWFAKFPNDIVLCEQITKGDPDILEKEPYVERNDAPNYKEVFGSPSSTPSSLAKKDSPAKGGRGRKRKLPESPSPQKKEPPNKRPIVHPRFQGKVSDHQVKILPQPSSPYHLDLIKSQDAQLEKGSGLSRASTGASGASPGGMAGVGKYNCQICGFSASRLNVIVLHNKSHSESSTAKQQQQASKPQSPASTPRRSNASTPRSGSTTPAAVTPKATPPSTTKTKTPKPAAAAPATKTESPAKRGRPRREIKREATPAKPPPPAKTMQTKPATPKPSPVKEERKPRMTKKRKEILAQEQERKKEDRKKILGDWSEEEEDEEEEKKKIKEVLEPFIDSSEEDENEDWMMDDNVQGNVYEGEEDEDEVMEKDSKKVVLEKVEKTPEKKDSQQNGEKEKPAASKTDADLCLLDIGKVLEETSVPALPSVDLASKLSPPEAAAAKRPGRPRKSVSFALSKPKEIVQKNIALVQPESNLDVPPIMDDDFDEFVNDYPIPTAPPKVYSARRILKKAPAAETPKKNENDSRKEIFEFVEEEEKGPASSVAAHATPSKSVTLSFAADWEDEEEETPLLRKPASSVGNGAARSTVVTTITLGSESNRNPAVAPPGTSTLLSSGEANGLTFVEQPAVTQVSYAVRGPVVTAVPQSAAAAASEQAFTEQVYLEGAGEGETYLILMDGDGSGDGQTLYIDSAQLANGGLANMVLMTEEGVAVSAQDAQLAYSEAPTTAHAQQVSYAESTMTTADQSSQGNITHQTESMTASAVEQETPMEQDDQQTPTEQAYAAPTEQQAYTAITEQQVYAAPTVQQAYAASTGQQVYAAPTEQQAYSGTANPEYNSMAGDRPVLPSEQEMSTAAVDHGYDAPEHQAQDQAYVESTNSNVQADQQYTPQADQEYSAQAQHEYSAPQVDQEYNAPQAGQEYSAPTGQEYASAGQEQFYEPVQQENAPAEHFAPTDPSASTNLEFSAPADQEYTSASAGQEYSASMGQVYDAAADQAYSTDQVYSAPAGQQAADQEYAPANQEYAPTEQAYAPAEQAYAPAGQEFAPAEQAFVPANQELNMPAQS